MADKAGLIDTAEFLFPRDLEITLSGIKKALFIGSCLSEAYLERICSLNPSVQYEHILFNNAAALPARDYADLVTYDYQYIQLPLRHILTDAVVRIADNKNKNEPIDWLDLGKRRIAIMLEQAMAYNAQAGILSIVSTFFVPQGHVAASRNEVRSPNDLSWVINELNNYLSRKVREYRNAYIADVDMIANSLGKRFFLDDFIYFYTHGSVHFGNLREVSRIDSQPRLDAIYENRSDEFYAAIFRQIESIYRSAKQLDQVKLVIFDLDDTLWRGQIAEHYEPGLTWPKSDGWPLGVWETVQHLRWRGILVGIVSKNDISIVEKKWVDAVNLPFIKLEDFILTKVNWRPKAENIGSLIQSLSLTPKSVVFVDDHPIERAAVKAAFPEIRVIGSNPYLTRRILLWSAETQPATRTDETKNREAMLNKQVQREEDRGSYSREEFLSGLDSTVKLWEIGGVASASFPRLHELVNKTNQFNTTSKRWDPADYLGFWSKGGRVFVFSAKDRFTEYGLIGAIFEMNGEITQFVMSCRVLGMDVELAALHSAIEYSRRGQSSPVRGIIIPTTVNGPCRDVFVRSGFELTHAEEGIYDLPGTKTPFKPPHVTINVISME